MIIITVKILIYNILIEFYMLVIRAKSVSGVKIIRNGRRIKERIIIN